MSHVQVGQITNTRGGLGGDYCRRLVLTNADIIALPSSVPLLVPEVPDKIIMPALMVFKLDPWFADYSNIDNTAEMGPDWPSLLAPVQFDPTSLLSNGAACIRVLECDFPEDQFDVFNVADVVSSALGLVTTNGVLGNYHGGDPGNVLTITTFYNIF